MLPWEAEASNLQLSAVHVNVSAAPSGGGGSISVIDTGAEMVFTPRSSTAMAVNV
jgi:hypothetical protein